MTGRNSQLCRRLPPTSDLSPHRRPPLHNHPQGVRLSKMGRSKGAAAAGSVNVPADDAGKTALAAQFQKDGGAAFHKRQWVQALSAYDTALSLLGATANGGDASARAVLHSNRAACFHKQLKLTETIREASEALRLDPSMAKAQYRRAQASEAAGYLQLALNDYKGLADLPGGPALLNGKERHVADLETRVKADGALSGLAARQVNEQRAELDRQRERERQEQAAQQQQQRALPQEVKLVHKGDVRVWRFAAGEATFAALLDTARTKFPGAWPFKLTSVDANGETITHTCRDDLSAALALARKQAVDAARAKNLDTLPSLPAARVELVSCPEADAPTPPEDEARSLDHVKQFRKAVSEAQASRSSSLSLLFPLFYLSLCLLCSPRTLPRRPPLLNIPSPPPAGQH